MDEDEYLEYCKAVFGLREYDHEDEPLQEQLRDSEGFRVDGCYRTKPAPSE